MPYPSQSRRAWQKKALLNRSFAWKAPTTHLFSQSPKPCTSYWWRSQKFLLLRNTSSFLARWLLENASFWLSGDTTEMPRESSVIYAVALDRMASKHVNADRIKVLCYRCSFYCTWEICSHKMYFWGSFQGLMHFYRMRESLLDVHFEWTCSKST